MKFYEEERLSCWLFFLGGGLFINVPYQRDVLHTVQNKKDNPQTRE